MKMRSLFLILMVGLLFILPVSAFQYYTIPIQALSSSPADSIGNYMGMRLNVPEVGPPGYNLVYFPSSGTIERIEIYDNSTVPGSNDPIAYYIRINNVSEYLIDNESLSTGERRFSNSTIRISITSGDYFEINRTHPNWGTNPTGNTVGGYIFFNSSEDGYTLPFMGLANSPADGALNYFGHRPIVPSTSVANNKVDIPMDGNLTKANIIMNSTGNSTAEQITYEIMEDGAAERRINTLGINSTGAPGSTLPRQFNSTTLDTEVRRGNYLELKRYNPTWVFNPLNDVTYGNVFINTSITRDTKGYMLYVQHTTASTTDSQTTYFGNTPRSPQNSAAGTNKIYVPKAGYLRHANLYTYSGTAGTGEPWSMYVRVNNTNDYFIAKLNSTIAERQFKNISMNIPIAAESYIEIKSVQPSWATNPATVITGGYVWIEYGDAPSGGGDIVLPPVANYSVNLTSAPSGATLKFFDQSNNTIPETTAYYWNFIDGGVDINSTDQNPTFIYASPGTYTINHTIANGATISKATGQVTITGGSGVSLPIAAFNIQFIDASTQYPTSWKWNATNLLGNNTEVTFSTSQNPLFNFGTGNWKINMSVSNAFGTNTTNQTVGWNLTSPRVYFWSRTA